MNNSNCWLHLPDQKFIIRVIFYRFFFEIREIFCTFLDFWRFRTWHEMHLYATYGHNSGTVGKLGISAFEWYQSGDLRININAFHEQFELLTSFTGSKIYNSRYFFIYRYSHLPDLWVPEKQWMIFCFRRHWKLIHLIST